MSVETKKLRTEIEASVITERGRFTRLLLVDDNESLLTILTEIFEEEGFEVTACTTATEALLCIQKTDFSVAVLDLRLPDMQGTQLLKKFHDMGSRVRVIINTGYGAFDSAKDAVNFGAFAYLEKAGDPTDLVRQVHRAYRSHFEHYADDLEAVVAERTVELSESEKRLRLVYENAPVCLWHEDFSGVKQQLDSLRQSGVEDFREYFEHYPEEVIECSKLVTVRDVNHASLKLHNAESKFELIESLRHTFCEESYGVFREKLIALANNDTSFKSDAMVLTLDGKKKDVILRMFVEPDSPNWSSVYVAMTDITERKQAEEEKRKLQAQLRHSQKMDAIGQLAAGVAHEFNNILVGILGNVDLLLLTSGDELPESFIRPLKDIDRAGTRAAELTKQLLFFARKKKPKLSLFDINRVITGCKGMLERLISTKITLKTDLTADPALIHADESDIEQAITNLVMNARDAMPYGGTLTIQTDSKMLDASEVVPGRKPGRYVRLSVIDDGYGMSPIVVDRIFEPFFTTKQVGKGTGLGLSTVFADVNSSGGFITVDSLEGEGTTFCAHFPQAEGSPEPTIADTKHSSLPIGGNETILICDDEEIVLKSVSALLKTLGYVVISAQSPQEAIGVAKNHEGTISLLLTDFSMPEMDGIQLCKEIARLLPEIKVIVTSGFAEDIPGLEQWENGHFEFIQKPAPFELLSRTIRNVLDKGKSL